MQTAINYILGYFAGIALGILFVVACEAFEWTEGIEDAAWACVAWLCAAIILVPYGAKTRVRQSLKRKVQGILKDEKVSAAEKNHLVRYVIDAPPDASSAKMKISRCLAVLAISTVLSVGLQFVCQPLYDSPGIFVKKVQLRTINTL